MDRDTLDSIRTLLQTTRVLSLAVLVDDAPEAALLPFAVRKDFGAIYVQASTLARHAAALQPGARVGVLVHANDTPEADPMQLPRLSVAATVTVVDKESERFGEAAARLIERFPAAGMTLGFADFNLYELTLGNGRYVEGFARAFDVSPDTFARLRPSDHPADPEVTQACVPGPRSANQSAASRSNQARGPSPA